MRKRRRLNEKCQSSTWQFTDEEASKYACYKLFNLKIVQCEKCHHYSRHPNASEDLNMNLVPNYVSICLKKQDGCKHKCIHMQIKYANLLLINCKELRHIHSHNALSIMEVKDDPANILTCLLKNCSKECDHMVSAECIKRCQRDHCKTFHQISKLGKGSFGSVWKVRTPPNQSFYKDHPFVAMKRISDDPDADTNEEIEILIKLQHKNIVKYLTSYTDDSTNDLCIIMEYCGNANLEDFIKRKLKLISESTEKFACIAIKLLASALDYIHEQGIIHRDIKPANILCDLDKQTGKVDFKLADFGLAKVMEKSKSGRRYAESYCGTEIYMSPEVLKGQMYGTPTDIWSLGAVIYFICNGGKDLFANEKDVMKWRGGVGKSILEEKMYSIYLQKIVTDMLSPEEDIRPTANQLWQKSKNLLDILMDSQPKPKSRLGAAKGH